MGQVVDVMSRLEPGLKLLQLCEQFLIRRSSQSKQGCG